jgi:serine/threonine protein kinase
VRELGAYITIFVHGGGAGKYAFGGYTARQMVRKMGRYELVRPLGRGGMAEVFVARRRGPGGVEKRLVVKRIRRERAADPRFLQMFVEEARLSMSLAHKNIVPMFDFGRAGDDLFLAMELVDGSDFGTALGLARRSDSALDPMLVAYVGMEACSALDYAHAAHDEQGQPRAIVHRDVTPGNVLLSTVGEVKLVDFGVATTVTEIGTGGRVRGTPAYMSPEQARGDAVDGRSDVFSLGLVLWEALAGRRAYAGKTAQQLLEKARAARVPELPDTVPDDLRSIVHRAVRADPDDRYASARDMQLALDSYVVKSRAVDGGDPPSHRLAEWIAGLDTRASETGDWGPEAGEEPVVTFLDDGLDNVTALGPGMHTMRSLAETIGDDGGDDGDDEDSSSGDLALAETQFPSRERPHRSRWPIVVAIVGSIGVVAVAAVVALQGRGSDASSSDAAPVAIVEVDARRAVVPVVAADAAPIVRDVAVVDAGLREPQTDARSRMRTPDAQMAAVDAAIDAAPGTLQISSRPWAIVTVEGRSERCDETPCTLTLPPGIYRLHLNNPQARLSKDVKVEVISGKTVQVKQTLTR